MVLHAFYSPFLNTFSFCIKYQGQIGIMSILVSLDITWYWKRSKIRSITHYYLLSCKSPHLLHLQFQFTILRIYCTGHCTIPATGHRSRDVTVTFQMHGAHILHIQPKPGCGLHSTKKSSERRCDSCTFHDVEVPKFRFFTAISRCLLQPLICKAAHYSCWIQDCQYLLV